jgi:hypothetical protein
VTNHRLQDPRPGPDLSKDLDRLDRKLAPLTGPEFRWPRKAERPIRIVVHFNDDSIIAAARLYNSNLGGYDVSIDAKDVPDMVAQIENVVARLQRREREERPAEIRDDILVKVASIDVAGHGQPGTWCGQCESAPRLTRDHLKDLNHAGRVALTRLRELWGKENTGMTLRMCLTAQGEDGQAFIALLSETINARVVGWDSPYEIRPTGKEFTATPDKNVTQTDDTGRVSAIGNMRWYKYTPVFWAGRLVGWW